MFTAISSSGAFLPPNPNCANTSRLCPERRRDWFVQRRGRGKLRAVTSTGVRWSDAMSKHSTIVHTKEGQAHVSTKRKWMAVISMPHTGVTPYPCSAAELGRLGVFIKWTTDDAVVLASLNEAIVRL